MKIHTDELPERLVEGDGPAAELLRRFTRQPAHAPGENAAWDQALARLGRDAGRHRARVVFALVVGALAGAAALYVALLPHPRLFSASKLPAPRPLAPRIAAPAAAPLVAAAQGLSATPGPTRAPTPPLPDTPQIQLGRAAVGLPVGAAELVGEADVSLSPDGSARAFTTTTAATVELAAGALDLHVEKRRADADHAFEVQAGPYRFTVLGTVFRVARSGRDVTLAVTEGRVAVSQGQAELAVITAGGFWSGTFSASPTGRRETTATPATAQPPGRLVAMRAPQVSAAATQRTPRTAGMSAAGGACAARAAAGDALGAVDCFTAAAAGADLGAEVALYEAARLYRDSLGQPERAVVTLQEARRRFPTGALSTEVSLSLAELLPKLGRYREALDETASLLSRQPAGGRTSELHLLRGDVLRAGLGNCPAAEKEYAAAGLSRDDRVTDAAAFWSAVCLSMEGRRAEARGAFARYLGRPHPAHATAAWQNLQGLNPGRASP